MKKKFATLIAMSCLLLCGCNISPKKSSGNNGSGSNSSGEKTGTVNIEIYATNDIHGQIKQGDNCPGIGKLGTFLKQRKSEANTLLFDQGDAWQGSIHSNLNRGALITDIMNYVHYDARCIGNHDFDWGLDAIRSNTLREYNGYSTPVLAGNIYDYNFDTKTIGHTQQSDIGVKSVVLNVGDLKIGVLGGIGEDQITSINSLYTRDIAFKDHVPFIREEASHLKYDEGCDIIIGSIHTGQEDLMGLGLDNYVDLFLCGHTHRQETAKEGNTYYVQSRGYEQSFSHVTLTYSYESKKITKTKVTFLSTVDVLSNVSSVDPTIQSLLDTYNVDDLANTTYANNVSGYFDRYEGTTNMMSKAIIDKAVSAGYNDVVCSLMNEARAALPYGTSWTYADLFQSFPFDNDVYIATVKGSELQRMFNYDMYICRNSFYTGNEISLDGDYKIAVLDYVYFHTNTERDYNYFYLTGGTSTTKLTNNYRDILINWLVDNNYNNGNLLSSDNFRSDSWNHNKAAFSFV